MNAILRLKPFSLLLLAFFTQKAWCDYQDFTLVEKTTPHSSRPDQICYAPVKNLIPDRSKMRCFPVVIPEIPLIKDGEVTAAAKISSLTPHLEYLSDLVITDFALAPEESTKSHVPTSGSVTVPFVAVLYVKSHLSLQSANFTVFLKGTLSFEIPDGNAVGSNAADVNPTPSFEALIRQFSDKEWSESLGRQIHFTKISQRTHRIGLDRSYSFEETNLETQSFLNEVVAPALARAIPAIRVFKAAAQEINIP